MDASWAPFIAVSAVVGMAAGAAAWWRQRQLIGALRQRLSDAENSRREIAEHMLALHRRLDAQECDIGIDGDMEVRRRALEQALDQDAARADFPWLETLPGEGQPDTGLLAGAGERANERGVERANDRAFEPTQPATLRVDVNLEHLPGR